MLHEHPDNLVCGLCRVASVLGMPHFETVDKGFLGRIRKHILLSLLDTLYFLQACFLLCLVLAFSLT
jgi:hypothetical protein